MRKVKRGPGMYHIVDGGLIIAVIVKTGTRRDNYPWNWYLEPEYRFKEYTARDGKLYRTRDYGTGDSLRACTNTVLSKIEQYGVERVETVETDGN